jgi:hypothetical protein
VKSLAGPIPTSGTPPMSQLKCRWGIYTPGELKLRRNELSGDKHLIAGLLPHRSLSIVVGDSGLGKSPLLYQAALCVAQGIPFLGHEVSQGRVLYLDFENGLGDVDDLMDRLASHLGLSQKPEDLLLWNFNDAPSDWQPADLREMVRDAQPAWVIVDSLTAYSPEVEEKSSNVTRVYQDFRTISREVETTITAVHHLRKPSSKPEEAPASLPEDPHQWFLQVRGSRQIVNGSDVRIGIDRGTIANIHTELDGKSAEVAFVIAGFGRLRGNIAPMYVGRVLGEDGEAMGYRTLTGESLLFNSNQQDAYRNLSSVFSFKDAQRGYGRGAQATTDFLKKCISVGILSKAGREYRKAKVADQAE